MDETSVHNSPTGEQPLWAEFVGGIRDRSASRWRIVRLIPTGGLRLVVGTVVAQLVAGFLPVGFVLATARIVAEVPASVQGGVDSTAWSNLRNWLIAAAVLFFAIQLLLPVQALLGELLRRRIDDNVRDRMMAASFAGGGVAALEDPELLDKMISAMNMMRVAAWTPGAACAGLIALISRYLQATLSAALIGVVFTWWAAAAVLLAALVIRFGYRLGLAVFGRIYRDQMRARRKEWYFRRLVMTADAAKEIRVFGLLNWVLEKYSEAFMDTAVPIWHARRRIFFGPSVIYTVVALGLLVLALATAAERAATGAIGIGTLMVVTQASLSSIRIGGFIAEADVQTEYGMLAEQAVRRFEELTATAAGAAPKAAGTPAGPFQDPAGRPRSALHFDKVSFRYRPDGPLVLNELDLTIPAGGSLAIVGLNGAGKTTLVKLLARLYEPTSGVIRLDGQDIRNFPVEAWQRQVAAIFQDFVHFELSVRDNVGFGAVELLATPDRADSAIASALQRADASDFVSALPRGMHTPLSRKYTDGADLSGGQWQRIAIARALLAVDAGSTMLVLDEPTAQLDVRAEVAFFERFLDLTRGVTSLIISHRFSTVRRADRIVVLEHGRVLEEGTHEELLRSRGRYAELFILQAARFRNEDETDPPDGSGRVDVASDVEVFHG